MYLKELFWQPRIKDQFVLPFQNTSLLLKFSLDPLNKALCYNMDIYFLGLVREPFQTIPSFPNTFSMLCNSYLF